MPRSLHATAAVPSAVSNSAYAMDMKRRDSGARAVERRAHHGRALAHQVANVLCALVGKEIDGPDESRPRAVVFDVDRSLVVEKAAARDRIRETTQAVVDADDLLARRGAVGEGDHARAPLEMRFGHEARHQTPVKLANVAHRVPHAGGGGSKVEGFTQGGHVRGCGVAELRRSRGSDSL